MNTNSNISRKIVVGITGKTDESWREKMDEIERLGIKEAALFLEQYTSRQRREIYEALESSVLKKIPLIHAKNDMSREEFSFLDKKYNKPYFTIHEDSFRYLDKWQGFHKKLFLEFNFDNHLAHLVDVKKIGGFCVDLAHFKCSEEKWSKEFVYVINKRENKRYFSCNHANGYSAQKNCDLHTITKLDEFNYLTTLPKFIFGKVIAIETYNCISEQLEFKKYISELLGAARGGHR